MALNMERQGRNGSGFGSTGSTSATSSIKRIQRELKEISESPSRHWIAGPAKDDLFEWLFAVRGPPSTDFEGGIYTGKIVLPVNYPLAPPSITMLTPSGRWEVGKKICLSNTNYHAELWQPAWGIRTIMEALRSHFPVAGDGAVGALDWPSDLRKRLAKESLDFITLPGTSGQWALKNRELLPELSPEELKEELPEKQSAEVQAEGQSIETPPVQTELAEGQVRQTSPEAPGPEPPAQPAAGVPKAAPRRRREGDRPRRSQQSLVIQLLKPPTTGRGWLLASLNILIVLVIASFCIVLADVVRQPPSLLNPSPDQKVQNQKP